MYIYLCVYVYIYIHDYILTYTYMYLFTHLFCLFVCSFSCRLVLYSVSHLPSGAMDGEGGYHVTPEKQTLKNNPYPSFLFLFFFFSTPHPGTHPFSCLHENHPQTPEWDRRLKTFSC